MPTKSTKFGEKKLVFDCGPAVKRANPAKTMLIVNSSLTAAEQSNGTRWQKIYLSQSKQLVKLEGERS